jgi:hypothetical protein
MPAGAAQIADQVEAVDLAAAGQRAARGIANMLVGALWLAGFVTGQILNGLVYAGVAIRQGWRDARPPRKPREQARR